MPLSLLLDPRLWGLLIGAVLEVAALWYAHHKGVVSGRAEIQAQFDTYRLQAQQAALKAQQERDAEAKTMRETNEKVTANYESLKTATATAVRTLDSERMRLLSALAAAGHSAAPSDPQSGLPADATAEDRVLGQCLARYEDVAGDAQQLSDQVKALQGYVNNVVPK